MWFKVGHKILSRNDMFEIALNRTKGFTEMYAECEKEVIQ